MKYIIDEKELDEIKRIAKEDGMRVQDMLLSSVLNGNRKLYIGTDYDVDCPITGKVGMPKSIYHEDNQNNTWRILIKILDKE